MKIHKNTIKNIHYVIDRCDNKSKKKIRSVVTDLAICMEIPIIGMLQIVSDYTGIDFSEDIKDQIKFYGE